MNKFGTIVCGALVALSVSSAIYADSGRQRTMPSAAPSAQAAANPEISAAFDETKRKVDKQTAAPPLVLGTDIEITAARFVFYKSNLEMTYKLENRGPIPDDDKLIDILIEKALTVRHARKLGIKADQQELNNFIQEQRDFLSDSNAANYELVNDLMRNRIRITGLSEDEFWQSDETKKAYEEAMLIGNLSKQLQADGEIKDMTDFDAFQHTLLLKEKGSLTINKSLIRN